MIEMKNITIAADFVYNMLEGVILKGINPIPLLIESNIPTQIMSNKNMRIDAVSFSNLSLLIVNTLKDESCGLLQKPQKIGSLNLMLRASFSFSHIDDSLHMWAHSSELINSGSRISYSKEIDTNVISVECDKRVGIISDYIVESTLLFIHRFHCWLAKEFLPIIRVELNFPAPSFAHEYRNLFYGSPVVFSKQRNALVLANKTIALPVQQNRAALKKLITEPDINLLTLPRTSSSMEAKVRIWLENVMHDQSSPPEQNAAAKHFETTPHTLRRWLQKEGTSFQKIKEYTRRDLAIHLIKENKLSVESISFQLGFSDASSFSRAFKSWMSIPPKSYRQIFCSDS